MLDVERDAAGHLDLGAGRCPASCRCRLDRGQRGAARAHSAGLVSAGVGAIFGGCYGDGAFRVQLVHLSPDFVNIILIAAPRYVRQKDGPALTCPAASRRRTAPSSCGAAGGDALNAVGHFVVVYRPTACT